MFKIRGVIKEVRGSKKHGQVDKALGEDDYLFKRTPCHLILPWKSRFSFQ